MADKKETTAVAEKKPTSFSELMMVELDKKTPALVADFNKERFVTNAMSLLQEKPELTKYGQAQLLPNLIKGAVLNLDFFNKEAYLVPYGNTLSFSTSYTGMTKLCKLYSERPVKDIYANVVQQGDDFQLWKDNEGQHFLFKPKPFNEGSVVGAFAVAEFEDGGVLIDTMTLKELEVTRSKSKAKNAGAWSDFRNEMYKKVVIRRLCKTITLNFEKPEQKTLFEADTDIETSVVEQDVPDVVDVIDMEGEVIDGTD